MSQLNTYRKILHHYTLITPTLAVWSALLFTIIAVSKFGSPIKWILLALTSILVVITVICAIRWFRVFTAYHEFLKEKNDDVES